MNIPVPHVVVAFDKKVLSTLFKVGTNYEDLSQRITKSGGALLFDSQSNPNFISFEHYFGGENIGNRMKLTLIDPKREFEERFMLENSSDVLLDYLSRHPPQKGDPIAKIRADKNKTEAQKTVDIENFQKKFALELAINTGSVKPVYISYGIGSDLRAWSGPHVMILYAAEMSVQGSRQITLTFTATSLSFSTEGRRDINQTPVSLNLEGLSVEIDARSFPIDLNTFTSHDWRDSSMLMGFLGWRGEAKNKESGYAYPPYVEDLPEWGFGLADQYQTEVNEYLAKAKLQDAAFFINKIDIHLLITDIMRDLIRKATGNSNVIILLPNLNYTLAETIQQNLTDQGLAEAKKQVKKAVKGVLQSIKPGWESVGEYLKALDSLTTWNTVVENNDTYYHKFTEAGKVFYVLKDLLSGFGITLNSTSEGHYSEGVEGILKVLEAYREQDAHNSYNDTLRGFLNSRLFTAGITSRSDEGLPDYMGILLKMVHHIKRSSLGVVGSHFDIHYESDLKLLEFWSNSRYGKFPLFGGIDRKINSDEGVIIFGDRQLIRDFLYGAETLGQRDVRKQDTLKAYDKYEASFFLAEHKDINETVKLDREKREIEKAEALLNIVPLHPLDKLIVANKEYNEGVRQITYPSLEFVGPYGAISYIPDDFQHVDTLSSEDRKQIENLGIPVFRYNTQNPNVLDLKLKNSQIYRNNLNLGFRRDVARRATTTARGILASRFASLPLSTVNDVTAFIKYHEKSLGNDPNKQQKIIDQLANKFEAFKSYLFQGTNFMEQAEAAYAAYAALLDRPDNPTIIMDQTFPGDPVIAMAEFSERMYRDSLHMSITTLPIFHFGTGQIMMAPCMLFAQDAPILQTQSEMPKANLLNAFMSGWYTIMGFSHKISQRGASSEFFLVKMHRSLGKKQIIKEKEAEKEQASSQVFL